MSTRWLGLGLLVLLCPSMALSQGTAPPPLPSSQSSAAAFHLPPAPDHAAGLCTYQDEQEALMAFYYATGGPYWVGDNDWGTGKPGECKLLREQGENRIADSSTRLPAHCCWSGVECCQGDEGVCALGSKDYGCNCTQGYVVSLDLDWRNLTGPLPGDELANLNCNGGLVAIELQQNFLTGSIPSSVSALKGLRKINLAYNLLTGPIPDELAAIGTLVEVDMTWNKLSGKVPASLCPRNLALTHLRLSHNQLSDKFDAEKCANLLMLDMKGGRLGGPPIAQYRRYTTTLRFLDVSSNQVQGTVSPTISYLVRLDTLNTANNPGIVGTLPEQLQYLIDLKRFDMHLNNMSGPMPPSLFMNLGSLQYFDVGGQWINGSIPSEIGFAQSLQNINLRNNSLYGTIPESMAVFARPGIHVDLRLNYLSCCGVTFTGDQSIQSYNNFDYNLPRLPSFLKFSTHFTVLRIATDALGEYIGEITCRALLAADAEDVAENQLTWYLDDEYYIYDGCSCDAGYKLTQVSKASRELYGTVLDFGNIPTFICVRHTRSWVEAHSWIWILIAGGATAFIVLIIWFLFFRNRRMAIVQWYINLLKRAYGEPTSGELTVVVLQVETIEKLAQECPEALDQGIHIVAQLVKKVAWANFGYVLELTLVGMERGSFTISFHEPLDATVFGLQLQSALPRQDWPSELMGVKKKRAKKSFGSKLFQSSAKKLSWAKLCFTSFLAQHSSQKTSKSPLNEAEVSGSTYSDKEGKHESPAQDPQYGKHSYPGILAPRGVSLLGQTRLGRVPAGSSLNPSSSSALTSSAPQAQGAPPPHSQRMSVSAPNSQGVSRPRSRGLIPSQSQGLTHSQSQGVIPPHPKQTSFSPPNSQGPTPPHSQGITPPQSQPMNFSSLKGINPSHSQVGPSSQHSSRHCPPFSDASSEGNNSNIPLFSAPLHSGGFSQVPDILDHDNSSVMGPAASQPDMGLHGVHGLNVATGIATGVLGPSEVTLESYTCEIAKVICNAGSGGQVLMAGKTFTAVKERLEELGPVDHDGMPSEGRSIRSTLRKGLMFWNRNNRKVDHDRALVYDMGSYVYNSEKIIPLSLVSPVANAIDYEDDDESVGSRGGTPSLSSKSSVNSRASSVEGDPTAVKGDVAVDSFKPKLVRYKPDRRANVGFDFEDKVLRLFHIMTPKLAEEGVQFNEMNLEEEWVCIEKPYFYAPGVVPISSVSPVRIPARYDCPSSDQDPARSMSITGPASLSASLPLEPAPMFPAISMVFCMVDGGKTFSSMFRRDTSEIHRTCVSVVRSTLRQVYKGYLCRKWDGELKYMVAFENPAAALSWCLTVQECLMYADWPSSVHLSWPEERDDQGRMLFRGPRMKMGLCHGFPRTIEPDHLGRADYLGTSINTAARYMDAAAHGGQIVCDEETAAEALAVLQKGIQEYPVTPFARAVEAEQSMAQSAAQSMPISSFSNLRPCYSGASPCMESHRESTLHFIPSADLSRTLHSMPSADLSHHVSSVKPCLVDSMGETCQDRDKTTGPVQILIGARPDAHSDSEISSAADLSPLDKISPSKQPNAASTENTFSKGTGLHEIHTTARKGPPEVEIPSSSFSKESRAVPSGPCNTPAVALKIGGFQFKGSKEVVKMVNVTTEQLARRKYPSNPPRGKGNRLYEDSGVFMTVDVKLPCIIAKYQTHWRVRVGE